MLLSRLGPPFLLWNLGGPVCENVSEQSDLGYRVLV